MNIKKNISIALVIMLVFSLVFPCLVFANAEGEFAGGDGTAEKPYLISTKEHLNNVRNYYRGSTFKLLNDIVFYEEDFQEGGAFYNDGRGFLPIGAGEDVRFEGTLLGDGHSIIGLRQTIEDNGSRAGLFGRTDNIVIKDLTIKDSYFEVKTFKGGFVAIGAFVGQIQGDCEIVNCRNESSINVVKTMMASDGLYVGGIVGDGDVESNVVNLRKLEIKDCSNTGNITVEQLNYGMKSNIGGILGGTNIDKAVVENCHNSGDISVSKVSLTAIGGVAGTAKTIKRCSNTGGIKVEKMDPEPFSVGLSGEPYVGGLSGHADRVEECFNTGNVNVSVDGGLARLNIGGLVGKLEDNMKNSFNAGKVTAECNETYTGGLVGRDATSENITNSYNVGQVIVTTPEGSFRAVGSLLGYSYAEDNTGCYFLSGTCESAKGYGGSAEYDAEVSKTKEEMTKQETFKEYDFETVWTMEGSTEYSYPELKEVKMPGEYAPQTPEKTPLPTEKPTPIPDPTPVLDIPFAGGDGTQANPYKISTTAQLNNVRNHLDAHFMLVNDIVFTEADFEEGGEFYNYGQGFMPIGHWTEDYDWENDPVFTGTFNGNGFAISGLYQKSSSASVSLFGRVRDAKIYDLTIKDSTFIAESNGSCKAAALVAWGWCVSVTNCCIESDVTVKAIGGADATESATAGGIFGYIYEEGSVSLSVNKASVTAERAGTVYAGGLVANGAGSVSVSNSFNEGTILAKSDLGKGDKVYAGGIMAKFMRSDGMFVSNCYNVGTVKAEGASDDSTLTIGGIVGCVDGESAPYFTNCYNAGPLQYGNYEVLNIDPIIGLEDFKIRYMYGEPILTSYTNCYYLNNSTDVEISQREGVNALSSEELKNQESFENWDFEEVWKIDGEYPTLEILDVITKMGDVTLDGKLNSRDLAIMQKMLLSSDEPGVGFQYKSTLAQRILRNINRDNDFNSRDIAMMQKLFLVG